MVRTYVPSWPSLLSPPRHRLRRSPCVACWIRPSCATMPAVHVQSSKHEPLSLSSSPSQTLSVHTLSLSNSLRVLSLTLCLSIPLGPHSPSQTLSEYSPSHSVSRSRSVHSLPNSLHLLSAKPSRSTLSLKPPDSPCISVHSPTNSLNELSPPPYLSACSLVESPWVYARENPLELLALEWSPSSLPPRARSRPRVPDIVA